MNRENEFYFKLLKEQITTAFLKNHNAPDSIEVWKGEEITLFQEDLFAKVKAKVSEKWFYTYFKNTPEKLPRIDMLNLLSKYVGQTNWNTFKSNHKTEVAKVPKSKKSKYLLLALIPLALLAWFGLNTKNEFEFCFVEDLSDSPIVKIPLDIKILSKAESPIGFKTDSLGCFTYSSTDDYIKFVVKSPYHKTDTIVRFIESNQNQKIQLEADDYALMLKFYTDGNVADWKKHKTQLQNLIAEDAIIYQMHGTNIGVELFSKNDFVRMLTIPTSKLKQIKILNKELKKGKIVKLKFIAL